MFTLAQNNYTSKDFRKRLKVSEVLSLGDRDFLKEEYNNFTKAYKSTEYKQACIRVFTNNERFFWHLVSISTQELDTEAKELLAKFESEILRPSLE